MCGRASERCEAACLQLRGEGCHPLRLTAGWAREVLGRPYDGVSAATYKVWGSVGKCVGEQVREVSQLLQLRGRGVPSSTVDSGVGTRTAGPPLRRNMGHRLWE